MRKKFHFPGERGAVLVGKLKRPGDVVKSIRTAWLTVRDQMKLAVWAWMGIIVPLAAILCGIVFWKYWRNRDTI